MRAVQEDRVGRAELRARLPLVAARSQVERREHVRQRIAREQPSVRLVFVESICDDENVIERNLVQKVLELWGDMQSMGRNPDYLTYIELLRAFGKGGALPLHQAAPNRHRQAQRTRQSIAPAGHAFQTWTIDR